MTKKPTKLQQAKFELETSKLTIVNQKHLISEITKDYNTMALDYIRKIDTLNKEFTDLKEAWQSQQYEIKDLKEYKLELEAAADELESRAITLEKGQHSFYDTSKYHFNESQALKRVIFKYEIFTISVVALVTMHIVWLFT